MNILKKKSFKELFKKYSVIEEKTEIDIVLEDQYKKAYELLEDAETSQLTPILVGPPGVGKTLLCRYYAQKHKKPFYWLTMDESTKPVHLIGGFDPAIAIKEGFSVNSFVPGPLVNAMLEGGYFLANELNRSTEYAQNTFLEPLEERSIYIPRLGRIKANDEFFMICSMNPAELSGTHRISEALKDRIKVWIPLKYPNKSTELKIIRANCPESDIPEDMLESIYQIIHRTRLDGDVEQPASIRAGIAIARLASLQAKKNGEYSNRALSFASKHVLSGSIKARPGIKSEDVSNKIIKSILGV